VGAGTRAAITGNNGGKGEREGVGGLLGRSGGKEVSRKCRS